MRLVCVNCDAEYEVDAAAIPLAGRDVQCSNCGHAWFQPHPDAVAGDEAEQDIFDAEPVEEVEVEPADEVLPETPPPVAIDLQKPPVDAPPTGSPAAPRTLDETVLAVLREEAEREAAARRAEAAVALKVPVIETQTELPLAQDQSSMAAAARRIARLRSAEAEPVVPPLPPKSRREMFPAIEDINSTLRASSDRSSDEDNAIFETMGDGGAQSGFRRGFLVLLAVAVLLVVLYVFAPVIADRLPALAGIAEGYVKAIDAARIWLDVELRALIAALRGLAGGQGG